jgi:preprotein translocase subunit SecF
VNIIGHRKIWYTISLVLIVPGVISLCIWGLRLGIDFKGGAEETVSGNVNTVQVLKLTNQDGFKDVTFVSAGGGNTIIRYLDTTPDAQHEANHQTFKKQLAALGLSEQSFSSIGPAVSSDIARNALLSLVAASVAIVLYVAFAFRNAPRPVSPMSFGVMAIVALLHDSLFVLGVFSILGHFARVEIDSLFVTAILTVIGFSVHDTIVVFDRIRENLRRERGEFETIVNHSILETFVRSINTSLTVLLTLLALFLFGGASIHLFVLALILGIASGTYSSIFNASPLLVTWHNYKLAHPKKDKVAKKAPRKATK